MLSSPLCVKSLLALHPVAAHIALDDVVAANLFAVFLSGLLGGGVVCEDHAALGVDVLFIVYSVLHCFVPLSFLSVSIITRKGLFVNPFFC